MYAREAETLVLDAWIVSGVVFVAYNHTVTVARRLRASVVCALDAEISADVEADRIYEYDIPMQSLFGVGAEEQVAAWMLDDAASGSA